MKLFSAAAAILALAQTGLVSCQAILGTPSVEFLYTSNISLGTPWDIGDFGLGSIQVVPIKSGDFAGPKVRGTILPFGGDWLHTDTNNVSMPDARYILVTDDNANIYISTFGASLEDGRFAMRAAFQTSHPKYIWMNYIITYGTLWFYPNPDDFRIQIDMWQVS